MTNGRWVAGGLCLLVALSANRAAVSREARIGVGAAEEAERAEQLIREGRLHDALIVLDGEIRSLAGLPGRERDLAHAYASMGIAYARLGQRALAVAKFRRAIGVDPTLQLATSEGSDEVRAAYRAARDSERVAEGVARQARRKPAVGGILLTLAGAATGAGIARAVRHAENTLPVAIINVSPTGRGVVGVTRFVLEGSGRDAESTALTYEWNFGDGVSASGQRVTHVYSVAQNSTVTLDVGDESGGVGRDSVFVRADSLTGTWRLSQVGFPTFRLSQNGAILSGTLRFEGEDLGVAPPDRSFPVLGSVADPRRVRLDWQGFARTVTPFQLVCSWSFDGVGNDDLSTMSGFVTSDCGRNYSLVFSRTP